VTKISAYVVKVYPRRNWNNRASPCSNCMHQPVTCMHQPVMSQANACTYCMGSKVSSLSQMYLYSTYFALFCMQTTDLVGFLYPICRDKNKRDSSVSKCDLGYIYFMPVYWYKEISMLQILKWNVVKKSGDLVMTCSNSFMDIRWSPSMSASFKT
jgi:hypothetical protein